MGQYRRGGEFADALDAEENVFLFVTVARVGVCEHGSMSQERLTPSERASAHNSDSTSPNCASWYVDMIAGRAMRNGCTNLFHAKIPSEL